MTIGKRIKEARKAKGWTQRELSLKSNRTISYISAIECGVYEPSSRSLMAFERALGMRIVE